MATQSDQRELSRLAGTSDQELVAATAELMERAERLRAEANRLLRGLGQAVASLHRQVAETRMLRDR
jgi:hypothetical protein